MGDPVVLSSSDACRSCAPKVSHACHCREVIHRSSVEAEDRASSKKTLKRAVLLNLGLAAWEGPAPPPVKAHMRTVCPASRHWVARANPAMCLTPFFTQVFPASFVRHQRPVVGSGSTGNVHVWFLLSFQRQRPAKFGVLVISWAAHVRWIGTQRRSRLAT